MEHQEDASDRQNDEEEERDPSQAECIGESEAVAFDLSREDVEEEVVIDDEGPLQISIGDPGSEDRAPYCRLGDSLRNVFPHLKTPQVLWFQTTPSNEIKFHETLCRALTAYGTPPS